MEVEIGGAGGAASALLLAARVAAPRDEEAPKSGGTLTYVIPADAPPSFDGHREAPLRRCIRRRRSTAC